VLSILPFTVHHLGIGPSAAWTILSGLLAIYFVIPVSIDTWRWRKAAAQKGSQFHIWAIVTAYSLGSLGIVTQMLNALDIGFHRAFGPFFLGLSCLLLTCVLMFIRLLSFVGQQLAEG